MDDKIEDQARSNVPVDDYEATLAGAGRWADIPGGTLYTNDANVLFLKGNGSTSAGVVYLTLDKAYRAGETATHAFDRIRNGAAVTTGDLTELA